MENNQKYCKHCGQLIDKDCVVCPKCGKQVEDLRNDDQPIIINNSSSSSASAAASASAGQYQGNRLREKNKWVAFFLCLFLGFFGAHKFYEGKILFGVIYIFTFGLFGIGWIVDLIILLLKPNPYYV